MLELGDMPEEYANMLEDAMRVATIHAAIHFMLLIETNSSERLLDQRAVALFMYSMLGVAFYHLIVRRMVTVRATGKKLAPPAPRP